MQGLIASPHTHPACAVPCASSAVRGSPTRHPCLVVDARHPCLARAGCARAAGTLPACGARLAQQAAEAPTRRPWLVADAHVRLSILCGASSEAAGAQDARALRGPLRERRNEQAKLAGKQHCPRPGMAELFCGGNFACSFRAPAAQGCAAGAHAGASFVDPRRIWTSKFSLVAAAAAKVGAKQPTLQRSLILI